MINPFLQEWDTPFGVPPFDSVRLSHYIPAIKKAIRVASAEIKTIAANTEPADFRNTIAALDDSGELLGRITPVLFNLNSAETSKELQAAAQEASPLLTRFSNNVTLNNKLFRRISEVNKKAAKSSLDTDQKILLERKYRNFVLGGAALPARKRKRFREITEVLATLSLRFDENVLEETNTFELHVTNKADLAGLPESVVEMAAMEASSRNKDGWIFTLHFPSYVPFMQYADKRELREKMFRAYSSRGFHGNEHDNTDIILNIVNLRHELAALLGFDNYAGMVLGDRMADSQSKVETFLGELFKASNPAAKRDYENICKFAAECGHNHPLERWDWAYYSEKLKKSRFDIDDETLKPYFSLEAAEKAIFGLASSLYGIRFEKTRSVPVYHPEVKAFEVYDSDNTFLALLFTDYHPRPGKSGGAWMTSFRDQRIRDSLDIRPQISIVGNFTRPSDTRPSLLSFNELTTFLHEFGHALHGMLSKCRYESLSGTNVARDFVELPSQFMENFAYEKEWLDSWALHYQTKEKIADEMINKIRAASTFNEGYACFRQLGFAFLDMAWHTIDKPLTGRIEDFEGKVAAKTELFPRVPGTCISTSFAHIFAGGYAAGYYGYKWAEVLDADAFSHFTETGIFNSKTAASFRKNILEKGGSEKPMAIYVRFRGKEPTLDAFLKRSGLR
jgi:peptidyl-dipeptidase Dcp